MDSFGGRIAVITGAGSGMGRELARLLSEEGCHLALCDIADAPLRETRSMCEVVAPGGTLITSHRCDVADEAEVVAFRDEVMAQHRTDHVNLLFNNAGIGGGGSFATGPRADWERVFAVSWYGVYNGCRAFLPMLVAADEGHLVNTSSVCGFWASAGPARTDSAYCAAKFAIKGFSEALITDLRLHAPHVSVSVAMPGLIGSNFFANSATVLGYGVDPTMAKISAAFTKAAPLNPAEAARIILDGVRAKQWRILVGEEAELLDEFVRNAPEDAYEIPFADRMREHNVMAFLL